MHRPEHQQTDLTQGARAGLELDLIEARRRLEAARVSKSSADAMAVECRALADEARAEGRHMDASSYAATSIRWLSRVIVLNAEINGLLAEEKRLMGDAANGCVVQLTAEQCAAVDDTIGALA